jgi:hypothetical protein
MEFLSYIQKMAMRLKAISGPLKGQEIPIRSGLRIGRTRGDVLLNDSKVSSLHAFVTEEDGGVWLNDNGSKNGLRVGAERVERLPLREGVAFFIGRSEFLVIADAPAPPQPPPKLPEPPRREPRPAATPAAARKAPAPPAADAATSVTVASPAAEKAAAEKPTIVKAASEPKKPKPEPQPQAQTQAESPAEPEGRRWSDVLAELAEDIAPVLKDEPKAVVALAPAVRLTFIGGVQAETRWILGYGPRRAGAASIDLPIFETGAPDVCFEILPSPEGVTFRTNHPKQVTLNGEQIRLKSLKEGDLIAVGQTRIEVELMK